MTASGPSGGRPAEILADLVGAPLAAAGFDVEDVTVRRAGNRSVVVVAVDRDGGVDLDAVADASRVASAALDASEASLPAALRAAYTLEVTSRGVDAPLTQPRHWRRAAGRLVQVRRRGAAAITGRIRGSDDDGADLQVSERGRVTAVRVRYDEVVHAVVQLEFRRSADADGEEEL
ncbi:MAG TPA: ribosome maturation factor RimP [Mycobacteriales bacterium]|nr:ribosome maturation factor RimP [Mycobacteriales bacterium]